MPNTLIVGGQWGDEAKGKIVHRFAKEHDVVVRYNGGNNAGHTLDNVTLHLIPSGILYDHTINIMGPGMVINLEAFYSECKDVLKKTGVYVDRDHLIVNPNAHLILPQHIALDLAGSRKAVGTTGRGIGPAYSQKADRINIRVGDLYERRALQDKVSKSVDTANAILEKLGAKKVEVYDVIRFIEEYGYNLLQFAGGTKSILKDPSKRILFEGAQGSLLDIDSGTYPNVTSSNTVRPSAAQVGCYVKIDKAYGVFKTPMSRVGKGPFPTEWGGKDGSNETRILIDGDEAAMKDDDLSKKLREELLEKIKSGKATELEWGAFFGHKGNEYGATTKRARRLGPLDMVLARYSIDLNGLDGIVLTKMDVYSGIPKVPLCNRYFDRFDNPVLEVEDLNNLDQMKPEIRQVDGWDKDIFGAMSWDELPREAQYYVEEVERLASIDVAFVSTGPKSEHLIVR